MTVQYVKYDDYVSYPEEEMKDKAAKFYEFMKKRRTVRDYSDKAVPREIIDNCIRTAALAPNGANLQPWHFAVVSSSKIKQQIRIGAEKEEKEFYNGRAPKEWLQALAHIGTDEKKPFLEKAAYLICIFAKSFDILPGGKKRKHYYVQESVGIATGFLIAALHNAGLSTLTHTPSPMAFLNDILQRPTNERPFLVLVVGYPAENVQVPLISKKELKEIASYY